MMKHFKLALLAILLIIGCVLATQMEANDASLMETDHALARRARRGHGSGGNHNHGGSSGNNGGGNDSEEASSDDSNGGGSVGGSPCAPPPKSTTSGRPSSSTTGSSAPTSRPTDAPTEAPTARPTQRPTQGATPRPTRPTQAPTSRPTQAPTSRPSTTGKSSTSGKSSTTGKSSTSGSTTGLCDIVPTSQEPLKLLVPLYVEPGSTWDAVAAGASKVGTIAIINPNSGPASNPGSSYNTYMTKLHNAGVEMIGYVYTSYGARSISDVQKDIDTYASKYPLLTGIFFDEVSDSASDIPFYTQAYNYVMGKGYKHNILNPGVVPAAGYVDISTSIVVFEDAGSKFSASKSLASFVTCAPNSSEKAGYKYKFAGIAHTTSSSSSNSIISSMQNKGMGLVYTTDGAAGCCTYNDLVSYYSSEVTTISSINN